MDVTPASSIDGERHEGTPPRSQQRLHSVTADTTEREQAEGAQWESEGPFRLFMDNSPTIQWVKDEEGRHVYLSRAYEQRFGTRAADWQGKTDAELWPPEIAAEFRRNDLAVLAANHAIQVTEEARNPDGSRSYWLNTKFPFRDAAGRRYVAGIGIDITDRIRAQEALRDSEERFRALVKASSDAVYRMSPDWTEMRHLVGRDFIADTEEPSQTWLQKYIHPDDQPAVMAAIQEAIRTRSVFELVHRILRPDGSLGWAFSRAVPMLDAAGEIGEWLGMASDITARKEAEAERERLLGKVRAERDWFSALVASMQDEVWFADTEKRFKLVNPAALKEFGLEADMVLDVEKLAASLEVLRPDGSPRPIEEAPPLRALHGETVANVEEIIRSPRSGELRHRQVNATPVRDRVGRIMGSVTVVRDITKLKQAEASLRKADRRKDEFLAMLAHELRNPLTPIRNAAHIMGRIELTDPRLSWARETIEEQVTHLARLVEDLLDVSRIARGNITLRREATDLSAVVTRAVSAVQPTLERKGHALAVQLPTPPVTLDADPVRLTQILVNLLDNAAKFTPDGGHIGVAAHLVGGEVEIRVQDDGCGIAPTLLPHVFDPFRQGQEGLDRAEGGLGLGLTLVQRLTALHGGRVEAASAGAGRGATLTVRLPATRPAIGPPSVRDGGPRDAAIHQRILVVDDDEAVRTSTAMWLELNGYEVRVAGSGPAAIQEAAVFHPDVVLLDVGLPGMDGYAVAQRLRSLPGGDAIRLVAVTGYGDEKTMARSRAEGFDQHFLKPFDPQGLLDLLVVRARPAHRSLD